MDERKISLISTIYFFPSELILYLFSKQNQTKMLFLFVCFFISLIFGWKFVFISESLDGFFLSAMVEKITVNANYEYRISAEDIG